jgi:multiple sugar transport system substrate-binding protein
MTPKSLLALVSLLLALVLSWGCEAPTEPSSPHILTYTYDNDTRRLIQILEKKLQVSEYQDFNRRYKGLIIPQSLLLRFEPFVLALSTESKIPAVLLLDAPWVQRYGVAGWLYELETARFFSPKALAPPIAEAFSVTLPQATGAADKRLVAVPPYIKGNILFYRKDLLKKYDVEVPRTWEDLRIACRKIMAQEPRLKYGLILHMTNFINDFYPILWGYGGEVADAEGRLVLGLPQNWEACLAALRDLKNMQPDIIPGPENLKFFAQNESLRRTFFQGEALFMINWNTRTHNFRHLIKQCLANPNGCLTDFNQIGMAPIPCKEGHPYRYSNIGSFGWGVNRFSVGPDRLWVINRAREFIRLVTHKRFQVLNAEMYDQVPSLRQALEEVKDQNLNPVVLQVYDQAFAEKDMRLRSRPYGRRVKDVLEKHLVAVLLGERQPEEALLAALKELQSPGPI